MEQQHFKNEQAEEANGWEAWEASPRDGPAVFVVDTAAFDQGTIRGRWINPNDDAAVVNEQLAELLGRQPEEGSWAVVDQVGLGAVMMPETLAVDELRVAVDELTAQVETPS